ncbi:MAG TPA: ABC transporter ATP-binding protein, partial [Bdellovibrionales bacterium]|nr:ABC transporter ATP-binding protein [Bdellovibrionales bacterium]
MHLINLNDISKSYGARTLYHSVSFGIESGEKVGFIGPNGVGKSTLVKIIAGEILPDQGSVTKSQGAKISLLEQDPQFRESDSIFDAVGEKLNDPLEQMAEIYQWISMLELGAFGEDFLVSKLSGGWRKRVALARELITGPDLLILDEPTNHLDVSSILWLEEFLSRQSFACLVITHDRPFLQRVCKRIIDLDNRNPNFILDIKGDYLSYSEAKQSLLSENSRHQDVLKNKLHREREWLSRGPQARQTKQKARIEAAGELEEQFSEVKARNLNQRAQIDFGESERLPKKLIEAKGLKKSFGSTELFSDFNLLIRPQTRLGLLGDNGSGKSTLIQCLLGKIPVDAGEITFAENLQVSYFEQGKETLEDHKTVLQNICPEGDHVHFQGEFIHVRSYLERFLFYSHHIDQLVSKLSGGERARLRLAQLMLKKAQVLILDEPTNDLDM